MFAVCIYIYIYITACGFTAESAILHSCYYDIVTAAITPQLLHRECYVCGIYNRMRLYRRECYYTAAAMIS